MRRALIVTLALVAALGAGLVAWIAAPDEQRDFPSDPHAGRLEPGERARVLRAVDAVNSSVPESELVARGRVLFRSADVAKSGESCQTCHTDGAVNAALGTIDHPTRPGDFIGPRDAPALWGVGRTAPYRWAGETDTLDAMVAGTIQDHFKSTADLPEQTAALVAYLRTLDAPLTTFDRGRMSEAALRGEEVFVGKGGCIGCHGGPLFTDNNLHVTGVPQLGEGSNDPGARQPPGAFNTPMLRDLRNTAPYMHNGAFDTLEEVVEFYDNESSLPALKLTEQEKEDLVRYLESL
jgi:cytochrome c peroxidase